MPFLQFTIIHMTGSHLSRPMGESSNTVPTLSENFFLGCFAVAAIHALALDVADLTESHWGQRTCAVIPANRNHELAAILVIGEELNGLL